MIIDNITNITDKILLQAIKECGFVKGLIFKTRTDGDHIMPMDITEPLDALNEDEKENTRLLIIEVKEFKESDTIIKVSRTLKDICDTINSNEIQYKEINYL